MIRRLLVKLGYAEDPALDQHDVSLDRLVFFKDLYDQEREPVKTSAPADQPAVEEPVYTGSWSIRLDVPRDRCNDCGCSTANCVCEYAAANSISFADAYRTPVEEVAEPVFLPVARAEQPGFAGFLLPTVAPQDVEFRRAEPPSAPQFRAYCVGPRSTLTPVQEAAPPAPAESGEQIGTLKATASELSASTNFLTFLLGEGWFVWNQPDPAWASIRQGDTMLVWEAQRGVVAQVTITQPPALRLLSPAHGYSGEVWAAYLTKIDTNPAPVSAPANGSAAAA